MVKAFFSTGKALYFTAASVKVKALAVFVVLCIFTSVLVPKFAIDARDYSALCQIIKSQSILFEFFYLSTLPVKILNELFNERHNCLSASQNKAHKGCTNNMPNTSVDFSITASVHKDISRFSSWCGTAFGCGNVPAVFAGDFSGLPSPRSGNNPGMPLVMLMLLMFYFLKARNALPDSSNIIPVTGIKTPDSPWRTGIFLCWLNPEFATRSGMPQKRVESGQQVIPLIEQDIPLRSKRQFSSMYLNKMTSMSALFHIEACAREMFIKRSLSAMKFGKQGGGVAILKRVGFCKAVNFVENIR